MEVLMKTRIRRREDKSRSRLITVAAFSFITMLGPVTGFHWESNTELINPVFSTVFVEKQVVYASEPKEVPVKAVTEPTVEEYIREVFGADAERAIGVATCESGLRKSVVSKPNRNGTRDYHTFQINDIHTKTYGEGFKTNWQENVRVAYKIFKAHGNSFRPWVCAKAIGEKNYLN